MASLSATSNPFLDGVFLVVSQRISKLMIELMSDMNDKTQTIRDVDIALSDTQTFIHLDERIRGMIESLKIMKLRREFDDVFISEEKTPFDHCVIGESHFVRFYCRDQTELERLFPNSSSNVNPTILELLSTNTRKRIISFMINMKDGTVVTEKMGIPLFTNPLCWASSIDETSDLIDVWDHMKSRYRWKLDEEDGRMKRLYRNESTIHTVRRKLSF